MFTVTVVDETTAGNRGEAWHLDIFEETHAAPYAARVRCERALLTRDQSELEAGMHVLETLGDLDQLARVERARSKSRGRS